MSNSIGGAPAPVSPDDVRPLPPRPNLEFERKQARKLLRQLQRGDADAVNRVHAVHRGRETSPAGEFKLADAQFAIAREYGFLSWPRLVEYFTTWERHDRSPREAQQTRDHYEWRAQTMLTEHHNRRDRVGRFLAIFVPRFYGMSVEEVFASTVSLDEVRLVVARQSRFPSWEALIEAAEHLPRDPWQHYDSPHSKALSAIRRRDLPSLQRIVGAHPELVQPRGPDERIDSLVYDAVWHERASRTPEARRITDWIVSQGFDLTETLNIMLLGGMRITTRDVAFLLERGADPGWMPPNGISVLEHALCRYWNGEALDLVARRVVPGKAFWIAAGLGDVGSLDRYLDHRGFPTAAAFRHRPDFTAIGPHLAPSLPNPDDLEVVWEAFLIAGLNSRFAVLDVLLERGFPIDYSAWGSTLLHYAIGNRMVRLVEYLVKRGADPYVKRRGSGSTARELAESVFENDPSDQYSRRILELCGGDPDTVMQCYDDKRTKPIPLAPRLQKTLELAQEEAARIGQAEVQPDDLFIALLRENPSLCIPFLARAGVDIGQFRHSIEHRLVPASTTSSAHDATYSAEAKEVLRLATAEAVTRRRESVTPLHLLYALVSSESGAVADILKEAGGKTEQMREAFINAL